MLLLFILMGSASNSMASTLLVWGDSLSAAYGMREELGWVALLKNRLGPQWSVINGSISGETTTGGLNRLALALQEHQPDVVVLGLGSNDALRGQALKLIRHNLLLMLVQIKIAGAEAVLLGNQIPPNYGANYANGFATIYVALSTEKNIPLVPFLLDGVATDLNLMQSDTLHPTAAAQKQLLENVWPYLKPLIENPA